MNAPLYFLHYILILCVEVEIKMCKLMQSVILKLSHMNINISKLRSQRRCLFCCAASLTMPRSLLSSHAPSSCSASAPQSGG